MAKQTKPEAPKPEPITYQAFSLARAPGGWTCITTTIAVDDEGNATVVDVSKTPTDSKILAQEKFKLTISRYWASL